MSFKEEVAAIRAGAEKSRQETNTKVESEKHSQRLTRYAEFMASLVNQDFHDQLLAMVSSSVGPYSMEAERKQIDYSVENFNRSIQGRDIEEVKRDLDIVLKYLDVEYKIERHEDNFNDTTQVWYELRLFF